ncbi:MAG: hypothetical protein ABIQ30_07460 [Devosia sp.]
MSAAPHLREVSVPRFALRRDEAATAVGISVSLFDRWISEGKMPKGRKIGGVVLWDCDQVGRAWAQLRDGGPEEVENPFDRVVW